MIHGVYVWLRVSVNSNIYGAVMTGSCYLKQRKIGLFLGVAPNAGGMFQYAQSILEALTQLGSSYKLIIAYSDDDWLAILCRYGLKGHALKHMRIGTTMSNGLMVLKVSGRISRAISAIFNPLVRELNYLACDMWIFPAQEALSYQITTPSLTAIHDLMHRYERSFPEVSARGRYGIREHRFQNIASWCTGILVDSKVGSQHVLESYGPQKSKIYVLPYVAPSYLQDKNERIDFDTHYKLPEKFLFYPAQFWPHKNHLRLLDALQVLAEKYPDMALVLTGGPHHDYKKIHEHAVRLQVLDRVSFIGYVPDADLRGVYRRARALIMPTFFGPTNIPPLEAMATGCAVLTSGNYAMPEQCGDAAIYFDPTSMHSIAECISKIWTNDLVLKKMIRKGLLRSDDNKQSHFNIRLKEIIINIDAMSK